MKRSCATCLWWCWDGDNNASERHGLCRYVQPGARVSPAAWPITVESDFCAAWEPRDRSLVRCETCEWYEAGKCFKHLIRELVGTTWGLNGSVVSRGFRCSRWRLREERDDG